MTSVAELMHKSTEKSMEYHQLLPFTQVLASGGGGGNNLVLTFLFIAFLSIKLCNIMIARVSMDTALYIYIFFTCGMGQHSYANMFFGNSTSCYITWSLAFYFCRSQH